MKQVFIDEMTKEQLIYGAAVARGFFVHVNNDKTMYVSFDNRKEVEYNPFENKDQLEDLIEHFKVEIDRGMKYSFATVLAEVEQKKESPYVFNLKKGCGENDALAVLRAINRAVYVKTTYVDDKLVKRP